jgi:hypothetical protein
MQSGAHETLSPIIAALSTNSLTSATATGQGHPLNLEKLETMCRFGGRSTTIQKKINDPKIGDPKISDQAQ